MNNLKTDYEEFKKARLALCSEDAERELITVAFEALERLDFSKLMLAHAQAEAKAKDLEEENLFISMLLDFKRASMIEEAFDA